MAGSPGLNERGKAFKDGCTGQMLAGPEMPEGSTMAEGGVDVECGVQCCVLRRDHRWSAAAHFCGHLIPSTAMLFVGSFKGTVQS